MKLFTLLLTLLWSAVAYSSPSFFYGQQAGAGDFPYIFDQAAMTNYDATLQAFQTNITVVKTGRHAIGFVLPLAGNGKTIRITINGIVKGTVVANSLNLANNTSAYFEDGFNYDFGTNGTYTVKVDVQTGPTTLQGVIIRMPDLESGVVEDQGTGQHCSPLESSFAGIIYRVHSELYSGEIHMSSNGIPVGKLFDAISFNEHYHNGCAILPLAGGLLGVQTEHNQARMHFKWIPNGDIANASVDRTFGALLSDYTYCQIRPLSNGDVIILTRGSNEDITGHGIILMTITNATDLVANVPAGKIDVLATDGDPYPRYIEVMNSGGVDAVVLAWAERTIGISWNGLSACIYAPAQGSFGKYYSLNGDPATVQLVLGTNGAPRFNSTMQNLLTKDGAGVRIMPAISTVDSKYGQRYTVEAMVGKVTTFPAGATAAKGNIFALFADNGLNDENSYGFCEIKYVQQVSGTRKVSPYDFLAPSLVTAGDPNSYRVSGGMRWYNDDPATDQVLLVMTDRGNRSFTNRLNEVSPLYYDWGGTNINTFKVTSPWTIPVFTLESANVAGGSYTTLGISSVYGLTNTFVYQTGNNQLHPTHCQSTRRQIQWMDTGGVTSPLPSGWGFYKNITFNHTNVTANLTNFPLYVNFTSDSDIGGRADATGQNIRFTASDGVTLLPYRRRTFAVAAGAATGQFVVLMPSISSSVDTVFRIWYDNSSAADGMGGSYQVYDDAYAIVTPMDQDPSGSAPQMTDVTYNTNNGTVSGSAMATTNSITGLAGLALSLTGTNMYIDYGSLYQQWRRFGEEVSSLTVETLIAPSTVQLTRDGIILSRGVLSTTSTAGSFTIFRDDVGTVGPRNNTWACVIRDVSNATTARIECADGIANTAGAWSGVAMSYLGSSATGLRMLINGTEDVNSPTSTASVASLLGSRSGDHITVGKQGITTTTLWGGGYDEMRMSYFTRPAEWIRATYLNLSLAAHGLTYSSEISQ